MSRFNAITLCHVLIPLLDAINLLKPIYTPGFESGAHVRIIFTIISVEMSVPYAVLNTQSLQQNTLHSNQFK